MATDPNLTDEQKRRQRELARQAVTQPPWARPQRNGLSRTYEVGQGFAEDAAAAASPPQNQRRPQVQFIDPVAPSTNVAADRQRAGLTRIYKSRDAAGNSVYTDQAYLDARGTPNEIPAGAEVRNYGAMGERIMAPDDAGIFQAAERQRGTLGRILADGKAIREGNDPSNPQDYQWVPDPITGRNTVMSRAQREAADPKLAAARAAGAPDALELAKFIEQQRANASAAADRQTGLERQQEALDLQEDARQREFARENPQAYFSEQIGALRQMDDAARDEFFQSRAGQRLASELENLASTGYSQTPSGLISGAARGEPLNFGELERAPWYSQPLFGPTGYTLPGDELQNPLTAEQLGINDRDLQWLIEYYGRRNARE